VHPNLGPTISSWIVDSDGLVVSIVFNKEENLVRIEARCKDQDGEGSEVPEMRPVCQSSEGQSC
jgi:hypothetical protein